MVIKLKSILKKLNNKFDKFVVWFNQIDREPRDVILAIIVGFLGGLGAFILRVFIYFVYVLFISLPVSVFGQILDQLLYGQYYNYLILGVVLASVTLGGATVGFLNKIIPPEKGDHGIPQVVNAVENNHGNLPNRFPFESLLKSVITIGSGGSTGREGPIVQMGGGSGSLVGKFFRVSNDEKKILIMAGVASGISATFNAPIGGLMFSFELFRRGDKSPPLLPLLVSSVVGSTVGLILIGNKPFLDFSNYIQSHYNIGNFFYFILMGAIIGVISVIWIIGFHFVLEFLRI